MYKKLLKIYYFPIANIIFNYFELQFIKYEFYQGINMYVIGTAGHVDHGKSALIHALTGIDPDRLKEEKERGMTIDLGCMDETRGWARGRYSRCSRT